MAKFNFAVRIAAFTFIFSCLGLVQGRLIIFAESNPTWQDKWAKTVEAANKEGRVTIYSSVWGLSRSRVFQKKYPQIKVVVVSGRGSQLRQRMLSEDRAGKIIADVVTAGARTNSSIRSGLS